MHLLVAPAQLMRPGIGRNASYAYIFREMGFIDGSCVQYEGSLESPKWLYYKTRA